MEADDGVLTYAEGVHLQEAVSGWLLRCHRPSALAAANASDTDGGGDAPGVASCAELWEELRRVFSLHLERFGGWLLRVARRKPWRLALETARKEARGGEPPPPRAVPPRRRRERDGSGSDSESESVGAETPRRPRRPQEQATSRDTPRGGKRRKT